MAGFATEADLQTALDAGNLYQAGFSKISPGSLTATTWIGYWRTGAIPVAGADPATTPGVAYASTAGGIVFPDTTPMHKYLIGWGAKPVAANANAGVLSLWDRLVGVGGIAVNSTGNKTVNSTALTRYTSGEGVQVWLEITTAGTTTAPIVSMNSYTNQAGTGGRAGATITFPGIATSAAHLVGPMPLQAGDTGVKSVETINVATAGGGSGVVSVILVKPLISNGVVRAEPVERFSPFPFAGMVRILDGATLMMASRFNGTSSAEVSGWYSVVFG